MIAAGKEAVRHNSIAELIAADMEFHMFLYELSRNRLFVDLMRELWNHLRRAMREVLQHREYRKAIWVEHEQILRAIANRDGEGAASLVRAHLQQAAINVQVAVPIEAAGSAT